MSIQINACFLYVDDVDAALVFYRDLLGFEVRNDVGKAPMRWVTLAAPGTTRPTIVMGPVAPDGSEDDQRLMTELLVKGQLGGLSFSADDLEATFERLESGGAEVVQEPIDQPWGARDCAFRDPAGNIVRIDQA